MTESVFVVVVVFCFRIRQKFQVSPGAQQKTILGPVCDFVMLGPRGQHTKEVTPASNTDNSSHNVVVPVLRQAHLNHCSVSVSPTRRVAMMTEAGNSQLPRVHLQAFWPREPGPTGCTQDKCIA